MRSPGHTSPVIPPATPIPRSYLGEPTKTRLVHAGSEMFHVYHLHGGGTRWRRNPFADDRTDHGDDAFIEWTGSALGRQPEPLHPEFHKARTNPEQFECSRSIVSCTVKTSRSSPKLQPILVRKLTTASGR